MNIWGKIIGGAAGVALGGPIGGIIGAIAGHAVDTYALDAHAENSHAASPHPHAKDSHALDTDTATNTHALTTHPEDTHLRRQAAFTIALIALSAKMAKADGAVTRNEILAFREKVDIAPDDMEKVGALWDLARETPHGYPAYAAQIARMFAPASAVLEQLMALLFHIARADGVITPEEHAYLEHVATILGFDAHGFARLTHIYGDATTSPYRILGLDPDCTDAALRQRWLELNRAHHPDRLMADGLPGEFIRTATDRLAAINEAYDTIKQQRGEANQQRHADARKHRHADARKQHRGQHRGKAQ